MAQAIALVGASQRSAFTRWTIKNLRLYGPDLAIWPVTPSHELIEQLATFASIHDLPRAPDAAVVAVHRDRSIGIVQDLIDQQVEDIVLISAGFSERGDPIGMALADELRDIAGRGGSRVWGPNCIGFADFWRGICAIAEPVPPDIVPGHVSIVSQSGALMSNFMSALSSEGVGLDWCVSSGNGTALGVGEAIGMAVAREKTRVVCAYVEGVADQRGAAALERALIAARHSGKTAVVLKAGTSPLGRRAVLSHTASIAGADSVFAAFLRQHGAIQVGSATEMVRSARVALMGPRMQPGNGVAVLGRSGGGAALAADLADKTTTRLARFSATTVARLREICGPGSFIENPLDILAVRSRTVGESEISAVAADESVGFMLMAWPVKYPDASPEEKIHRNTFEELAHVARDSGVPTAIASIASAPSTPWLDEYRARNPHIAVVNDLATTFLALGHFFPEETRLPRSSELSSVPEPGSSEVLSEGRARDLLSAAGVGVVAGRVVRGPVVGTQAIAGLRPPFAVKVVAPISHKARVGGVVLGALDAQDIDAAIREIDRNVRARGLSSAAIEGFLVEEMVFGREILVGLSRDDVWGKFLVVGLGGGAAELASRSIVRRLPLRDRDVDEMLAFVDIRGHQMAARLVAHLAVQFESGQLASERTIEINPLVVTPDKCYVVDAVVIRDHPGSRID